MIRVYMLKQTLTQTMTLRSDIELQRTVYMSVI